MSHQKRVLTWNTALGCDITRSNHMSHSGQCGLRVMSHRAECEFLLLTHQMCDHIFKGLASESLWSWTYLSFDKVNRIFHKHLLFLFYTKRFGPEIWFLRLFSLIKNEFCGTQFAAEIRVFRGWNRGKQPICWYLMTKTLTWVLSPILEVPLFWHICGWNSIFYNPN